MMDTSEPKMNYDQLKFYQGKCRCCMTVGYLRSLTQEYEDSGIKKIFNDMFIACFRLELVPCDGRSDEYLICEACVLKLEDCEKFKKQVLEAFKLFDELTAEDNNKWTFFDTELLQLRTFPPGLQKYPSEEKYSDYELDNDDFRSVDDTVDDPDFGWDIVLGKIKEGKKQHKRKKKKRMRKESKIKQAKVIAMETYTAIAPKAKAKSRASVLNRLPYQLEEGCLNCSDCGEQFFSKIRLSHHMNLHYPNHICHACGKGFAVASRLQAHLKSHIKSNFPCELCDKVYHSYNSRESHRRHHHGKLQYRCPVCRMRFMNYHTRVKHMSTEHGEEQKRHRCKLCAGTFSRASHLSTHVKMVHLKEKRVSCETCGAAFFSKSMLDNHMAGHIAKRDHICHICNRSYLRRKTLLYHMKVHKKDDKTINDKLPNDMMVSAHENPI